MKKQEACEQAQASNECAVSTASHGASTLRTVNRQQPRRTPKSDAHQRFGAKLRTIRERAGRTTREVTKPNGSFYASGHIANVEGGFATFPKSLLLAYSLLGGDYVSLVAGAEKLPTHEPDSARQVNPDEDALARGFADPSSPENLLRRGYAIDANEDTVYFGPDRVPSKAIHQVTIRPLLPMARFFVCRYGYDDDQRKGVLSVDAISGCDIVQVQESDYGVLDFVLEFNQGNVDDLGRCTISWLITYSTDKPATPDLTVGTKARIPRISKRAQFAEPALPTEIWWFRDTDPLRAYVEPKAEQVIPLNSAAYYFCDFRDVEAELCGLAWKWAG